MDASDVVVKIVSNLPEIARIRFLLAKRSPLLQERTVLTDEEKQAIDAGENLKKQHGLPFWDGVLLSCLKGAELPVNILREVSFHTKAEEQWLSRDRICAERLKVICQGAGGGMVIASSLVEMTDGSRRHIPMLDFHLRASPRSQLLAHRIVQELRVGNGFLLESGRSYHFYGEQPLKEELASFLGRALQYAPLVDRAWIAHQLIEQACGLRISARDRGSPPFVVMRVTS